MRRICAIILLLVLTAQAQAPTGVILIILRQVEQCLLTDALESVQTANLTRTAWTAARGVVPGMPPPQADWSAFERAFSALPANQAPAAGEAALRAMVDSLNDPYSTVVTPAERQFEETTRRGGAFSGVGVELAWRQGLTIVSCLDGSPALEAGLKPGDRILAVDGQKVAGKTFYSAGNLLLGPAGSKARLQIDRAGKALSVEVTRRSLRLPPVVSRKLPGDVGYVRVGFFGPETVKQVSHELGQLAGMKRLVLDLRGNPGGDYDQGIKLAGLFTLGPLLLEEAHGGKRTQLSSKGPIAFQGPLVLLVDAGTASAGEVVAQALQGRPGVTLVGRRTFGKARVQSFYELPGGGGLHLTTGRYLSLKGVDLNGKGLQPDVEVAPGEDALTRALK